MNFVEFRDYVSLTARQTADAVAADALQHQIPGAVFLLTMVLQLRSNRRSRRSFSEAVAAFALPSHPRWLRLTIDIAWNYYRVALVQDYLVSYYIPETNSI